MEQEKPPNKVDQYTRGKNKPAEKPKTKRKIIIPRWISKQSRWNNVMKTSFELTASARQMGNS
jgi:hypothetical protein